MHELGITQEIVAIAADLAGMRRVKCVALDIGVLTAVFPDAIRFCFDICAEGTPAEGARLDITEIPGRARCRACSIELILDRPFGICQCGGADLEWLAGDELRFRTVEMI